MRRGDVAGLILCGGAATRFEGGRKEEAQFEGRMLIEHVIARARPQVAQLALSLAADDTSLDQRYGLPVVRDRVKEAGPLAGLDAGLAWAADFDASPAALALFACDTPVFPGDHVQRLAGALTASGAGCALPFANGRAHPAMGLWRLSAFPLVVEALAGEARSLFQLANQVEAVTVEFTGDLGAYVNVNTQDDLATLKRRRETGADSA